MRACAAIAAVALLYLPGGEVRSAEAESEAESDRSVYRVQPVTDGVILGLASVTALLPYALTGQIIAERCPCDPGEINRFDRGAVGNDSEWAAIASDVTIVAVLVGPPLLDGLAQDFSGPFFEDLTVYAETLAINFALVSVVKHITQRPLPVVYGGQEPELARSPGGYRSFYSGHAATAFAALSTTAVTLHARHGTTLWPWLLAAGVGTTVAVERVAAGLHFPSDVIVGAAVGTAVGTVVPLLHLRPEAQRRSLRLVPQSSGLAIIGSF